MKKKHQVLIIVLAIAAYAGVVLYGALGPGEATVHVENFSAHYLALELDGGKWLSLEKGATEKVALRTGKHALVVRDAVSGKELDRMTLDAGARSTFVLNLLGAQTYYRGKLHYYREKYGPAGTKGPEEEPVREKWFRAGASYVLRPPPETKTTPEAYLTYLRREGKLEEFLKPAKRR